jgi:adenylylsulfate kinase
MSATAVLVTGTVGVGKSVTADSIGYWLGAERLPHAVIDLDEIRRYWPTPPDDPFGFEIGLRNLQPMVANYLVPWNPSSFALGVVQVRASQGRRGRDTGSYVDRGERRECVPGRREA